MSWMGNYTASERRSRFTPSHEPSRLVSPSLAHSPDSYGGFGAPSVTGSRHDQVAESAAEWFRQGIEALAKGALGLMPRKNWVYAQKKGSAGKYSFWAEPDGVNSWEQLQELSAEAAERVEAQEEAFRARNREEVEKRLQVQRDLAIPACRWLPPEARPEATWPIEGYQELWDALLEEQIAQARAEKAAKKAAKLLQTGA
jgi:hypothetical protein